MDKRIKLNWKHKTKQIEIKKDNWQFLKESKKKTIRPMKKNTLYIQSDDE